MTQDERRVEALKMAVELLKIDTTPHRKTDLVDVLELAEKLEQWYVGGVARRVP